MSRHQQHMRQRQHDGMAKVHKVMREFSAGALHSGSKQGPRVTTRRQALAIALAEARRAAK